jgi:hypothetical protein
VTWFTLKSIFRPPLKRPVKAPDRVYPVVSHAAVLRPKVAETEADITNAVPAEKARFQERSEVPHDWLAPKSIRPRSTFRAGASSELTSDGRWRMLALRGIELVEPRSLVVGNDAECAFRAR